MHFQGRQLSKLFLFLSEKESIRKEFAPKWSKFFPNRPLFLRGLGCIIAQTGSQKGCPPCQNMATKSPGVTIHLNLFLLKINMGKLGIKIYTYFGHNSRNVLKKYAFHFFLSFFQNRMFGNNLKLCCLHILVCYVFIQQKIIATDKRGYPHNIFLISPWKYMLWVLFRSALPKCF